MVVAVMEDKGAAGKTPLRILVILMDRLCAVEALGPFASSIFHATKGMDAFDAR